jgi:hypothetical protein
VHGTGGVCTGSAALGAGSTMSAAGSLAP